MKIREFNYDKKYIMMTANVDGITHLLRVDMKDCPLTLLGVFEAMDVETFNLVESGSNDYKPFRGNQVRIGVEAPKSVAVDREEIYQRKKLDRDNNQ